MAPARIQSRSPRVTTRRGVAVACVIVTTLAGTATAMASTVPPDTTPAGSTPAGSTPAAGAAGITSEAFGETADGEAVELYTLTNANGMEVKVMTYGGIIQSVQGPGS